MTLSEAAKLLNHAIIGLQKRVEVDRLARKHRPRFSAFFRNQKVLTLEKFKGYQFLFTESYRQLREEIHPNEFLTTHDWDRLWSEIDRDTFDELQQLIADAEGDGILKGGQQIQKMINPTGKFWDLANPRAVAWFQQNGGSVQYIKGIQQATGDQVRTIITKAIGTGQSYQKTAKEISDTFDGFSRARAQRIATHESAQAYEAGNMMFAQSLKDDGIRMVKKWMNSNDNKVSDGCLENTADGWIPVDQCHTSGHQQPPRFPGCRCYEIYEQAPVQREEFAPVRHGMEDEPGINQIAETVVIHTAEAGEKGDPGKDGKTPVKNIDYFDGKDGNDGKDGRDGQDGKDGKDGRTPVKGVDYYDGNDGQDGKDGKDGNDGKPGEKGDKGDDGRSAYEVWLDEGNQGSETDFLESLKGRPGKDGKDGQSRGGVVIRSGDFGPAGTHHTTHEEGGTDSIKLDDLAAPDNNTDLDLSIAKHGLCPKAPDDITKFLRGDATWGVPAGGGIHHLTHENGAADEISVAGLSGLLADAQNPVNHHLTHENGGTDEISVAGLSGVLADAQTPGAHGHAEGDVTNLVTDLGNKIAKATNVTAINDTGIADGEIAVFDLTNKDIRTSDKTIVTTLGADDITVPTSKAVKDVTDGKEPTLTKGNLTATAPVSLDQTRQVIGGAAVVSLVNDAAAAITEIDTGALANSDTVIPTSKAVKTVTDGLIPKILYDAQSILAATLDDTPAALTVAEQRLVGRITGGNVAALTATEVKTLLAIIGGDIGGDVTEATTWDSPITSLLSNLNRIRNQVVAITGEAWGTVSHSIAAVWAKFHATTGHKHSGSADDGGQVDHGLLGGLTDDDHERYFDKNASKALTGTDIVRDVDNSFIRLSGGSAYTSGHYGGGVYFCGSEYVSGQIGFFVANAAKTSVISVMTAVGNTDTPTVFFSGFKHGATSCADGGTITHGCGLTPTSVVITPTVANEIVAVTAKNATTFTVAIKKRADGSAGTTQTIYWHAWL